MTAADGNGRSFDALVALGDIDGAAADGETGVCVNAVVTRCDFERAARNRNGVVGVDRVVGGIDGKGAVVDGNGTVGFNALGAARIGGCRCRAGCRSRLCDRQLRAVGGQSPAAGHLIALSAAELTAPLSPVGIEAAVLFGAGVAAAAARCDGKGTVVDLNRAAGVHAVGAGREVEGAVRDIDIAERRVVRIFRVQRVGAGVDGDIAVRHADAVVGGKSLLFGCDAVGAAGDHQIVLGNDAVTVFGGDGERTAAVKGEIILGIYHRVDVVVVDGDKILGIGEGVPAALGKGDEHFVRLSDIQRGAGVAVDRHAVENQTDFRLVVRIHDDRAVVKRAGEKIGAFLADSDGAARNRRAASLHFGGAADEGDPGNFRFVVADLQILAAEHIGSIEECHGRSDIGVVF